MMLAKNLTSSFLEFVTNSYGREWSKSPFPKERYRMMVGESLLIVRDSTPECVDVFCTEPDMAKELVEQFACMLAAPQNPNAG